MVVAMSETFSSLVDTFRNVGVSRAYGTPVLIGGEELVPVALVSFGFGGGSAAEPAGDYGAAEAGPGADNGAAGGGGGGLVLPVGVYCRNGRGNVVFRPNTIAVLAALVPVVCAVGFSLRGVLRTLRS
jgi:uncharacterized spore protein YtfJ